MLHKSILLLFDRSLRLAPSVLRGCRGFIDPFTSTTLNKRKLRGNTTIKYGVRQGVNATLLNFLSSFVIIQSQIIIF